MASLRCSSLLIPTQVQAVKSDGSTSTLTSFSHPGGLLTVPYAVPKGTQLILLVEGRETAKAQVQ